MIPITLFAPNYGANGVVTDDLINSGMVRRLGAAAQIGVFIYQSGAVLSSNALAGMIRMVGDS
jgi:hypothetical protein